MVHSKLLSAIPGVQHGFTTKLISPEERIKLDNQVATIKQVHKADIVWVKTFEKELSAGDALATLKPYLQIGVYSADCVPTLLVAQNIKTLKPCAVMAMHGGWRSTALLLPQRAFSDFIFNLKNAFLNTEFIYSCAIGPCISYDAFEVHEDVVQGFKNSPLKENRLIKYLKKEQDKDKYLINLPGETVRQLKSVADREKLILQIEDLQLCTVGNAKLFPSYRRKDQIQMKSILSFISFS